MVPMDAPITISLSMLHWFEQDACPDFVLASQQRAALHRSEFMAQPPGASTCRLHSCNAPRVDVGSHRYLTACIFCGMVHVFPILSYLLGYIISYCIPCLHSMKKNGWSCGHFFPFWMSGPNQTGLTTRLTHCNGAYGRKLPPCFKTALGTRTVSLDNKADLDISHHYTLKVPPCPPSKLSDKLATIGFWVLHLRALATQRSAFWGSMQKHLIKDAWRGGEGLSLDSF